LSPSVVRDRSVHWSIFNDWRTQLRKLVPNRLGNLGPWYDPVHACRLFFLHDRWKKWEEALSPLIFFFFSHKKAAGFTGKCINIYWGRRRRELASLF